MSRYRSIIPSTTREGEFSSGGTGGFSPLESWQRLRTPEDDRLDAEARRLYQDGVRTHDFSLFNDFVTGLRKKGYDKKYRDRLVSMAGRGLRVR
jgi:hypothetical protein